ncbi:receptor activity-modifying protein 1-like [Notolabrus celidotus]|uniref:receptor activity-modifying protein 1-like n=1 Tax=Notolabrus celidotus TaxID=1203425 RepID=UPI0014902078|nr:receptor activity-modifying protein 1-like [Notolabrus celidotus]
MAPQVSQRPLRLQLIPSSLCTMILNLLVPALILGVVEAQTANTTEGELSRTQENQTFITSTTANYSTVKPGNLTSSLLTDLQRQVENELLNNQTFPEVSEENEDFQDQEILFPGRHCDHEKLVEFSHYFCGDLFHVEMMSIKPEDWCVLNKIIWAYNNMSHCLEKLADLVGCYYPNPNIHDFFIEIHSIYFHNCTNDELLLVDAPHWLVITLTLIPVSLIPVLVYLVVWKSKFQE